MVFTWSAIINYIRCLFTSLVATLTACKSLPWLSYRPKLSNATGISSTDKIGKQMNDRKPPDIALLCIIFFFPYYRPRVLYACSLSLWSRLYTQIVFQFQIRPGFVFLRPQLSQITFFIKIISFSNTSLEKYTFHPNFYGERFILPP